MPIFMLTTRNLWRALAVALSSTCSISAAELAHDLYLCANLSGQAAIVSTKGPQPSGLYRSRDRQNFEHVGFDNIRTFSMTHDPRDPAVIIETVLDGILRSPDRGRSWRRVTDWTLTEPKAIAFDLNAPDDVYAALPDGIVASHDRGQTWQRAQAGIKRAFTHALLVDRAAKGRVLAGTELGLYLTEDGARSWRLVQATSKVTYDLRQSPHDPKVMLAVTSVDGALWSSDAGRTWKKIEGVSSARTLHHGRFDPHNAQRLVVCGWEAGVLVSEDGGSTWSDRTAGLPNRQIWCVSPDPDLPGRLYAAPYLAPVHVSDDFGRTWRPLVFEASVIYDMVFVPRS